MNNVIEDFIENLVTNMQDLPNDIQEVIDEEFYNLVGDDKSK